MKFAGTGYLQVTGRYNHQAFSDYMWLVGAPGHHEDRQDLDLREISMDDQRLLVAQQQDECLREARKECELSIDEVGARVNGQMRPRGADERIKYTDTAYRVLIGV